MEILITLGVVFFIAYALLRLLAWIGRIWERGYLFAPTRNHGVTHTLASNGSELDEYFIWKANNPEKNIGYKEWKKTRDWYEWLKYGIDPVYDEFGFLRDD